jgi:hypothetical protein
MGQKKVLKKSNQILLYYNVILLFFKKNILNLKNRIFTTTTKRVNIVRWSASLVLFLKRREGQKSWYLFLGPYRADRL